jgi:hypothetical protein
MKCEKLLEFTREILKKLPEYSEDITTIKSLLEFIEKHSSKFGFLSQILDRDFFEMIIKKIESSKNHECKNLLAKIFFWTISVPPTKWKVEDVIKLTDTFLKWEINIKEPPLFEKIHKEGYKAILKSWIKFCIDLDNPKETVKCLRIISEFCYKYPEIAVEVLDKDFFKEILNYIERLSWKINQSVKIRAEGVLPQCLLEIEHITVDLFWVLVENGFKDWDFEHVESLVKTFLKWNLKPKGEGFIFKMIMREELCSPDVFQNILTIWIKKIKLEKIDLKILLESSGWIYYNIWLIDNIIEKHFCKEKVYGLNLKELLIILGVIKGIKQERLKEMVDYWYDDLKNTDNFLVLLILVGLGYEVNLKAQYDLSALESKYLCVFAEKLNYYLKDKSRFEDILNKIKICGSEYDRDFILLKIGYKILDNGKITLIN